VEVYCESIDVEVYCESIGVEVYCESGLAMCCLRFTNDNSNQLSSDWRLSASDTRLTHDVINCHMWNTMTQVIFSSRWDQNEDYIQTYNVIY
jgi:hypothetical protein